MDGNEVVAGLLGLAGGTALGFVVGSKIVEPTIVDVGLANILKRFSVEIRPTPTPESFFVVPLDPANPRVKVLHYAEPEANKPYVQVALIGVEDQDPARGYGEWTDVLIRAYQDKAQRKIWFLIACTGDWTKIIRYEGDIIFWYVPLGVFGTLWILDI